MTFEELALKIGVPVEHVVAEFDAFLKVKLAALQPTTEQTTAVVPAAAPTTTPTNA